MPVASPLAGRAPWLWRAVWLVGPLAAAPALQAALRARSTAVAIVGAVLAWGGWAVVLLAALVPRAVSLTVSRLGGAAAIGAAVAAWADASRAASVVALAWAIVACAVVLSAPVGDAYVDGSSYGPERRVLLRTPGLLLLGPVELAAAAVVAGIAAGPLLLAARQWVLGAIVTAVGALAVFAGSRAMHQLSKRWLVFVPGGLVLHDRFALAEPMLFPRALIQSLGPAAADTDATDLTANALGLVLELQLRQPVDLLVRESRSEGRKVDTDRVAFTPARPGTVLAEARSRRLPVA